MSWYYAENGRQAGPIDDATLDNMMRLGSIGQDTLVWKEGMANWQPLSTVRPYTPPPAPAPPPEPVYTPPQPQQQSYNPQPQQPQPQQPQNDPFAAFGAGLSQAAQGISQGVQQTFGQPQQGSGQGVTCANCGQSFPMSDVVYIGNSFVCAACKPAFMQRMREGGGASFGARRYGTFWHRFAAALIDGIILFIGLGIIVWPIQFAVASVTNNAMAMLGVSGILMLVQYAAYGAYYGYFYSTKGATPGKSVMGLEVIRSDGSRLTFMRGFARFFATIISAMIFCIGFIIAAFDNEARALHDYICDTRVVFK